MDVYQLREHRGDRLPVNDDVDRIFERQQARREKIARTTAAERVAKLKRLHDAMFAHRDEIRQALWDDYRKPAAEVDLSEIFAVVSEARHAMRHLRRWMRPERVATPLTMIGSRSHIVYEPKGVVLIISPWNFPINLTLGPLVSAIAAGNCAILKPSEMTPHASACMKRILAGLFDESEVAVIEGDASVAEALLRKKFDHIFFTGSPEIGKVVMKAAAEHLTSVTLELGGKSPVIVDRSADLDVAAKRIAWGKTMNSGQICIAPDYVLVDESVRARFLEKLREEVKIESSWLVNDRHAARISRLAEGKTDGRSVQTVIVDDVALDSALMREEIFGPLLPVIGYRDIGEALKIINERERPLVMYLFSSDRAFVDRMLRETRAGATVINQTLIHFYQVHLPFGGVGQSGFGKAHGRFGFEAFSNARAVLEQRSRFTMIQLLYPPYTALKRKLIDFTIKHL
ncbi:MAG TPA: aldehyde dehydrogenase family protein [Thermoanaerobaculia bacterium]|nr:aldehyde dehydrogenase family protein [Thermoanaerobaculia bacterium]